MSACSCWAPEGCPNSSTDGTDCTGVAAWSGKLLGRVCTSCYVCKRVLITLCIQNNWKCDWCLLYFPILYSLCLYRLYTHY